MEIKVENVYQMVNDEKMYNCKIKGGSYVKVKEVSTSSWDGQNYIVQDLSTTIFRDGIWQVPDVWLKEPVPVKKAKKGEKYIIINDENDHGNNINIGDVVILECNDGSSHPYFTMDKNPLGYYRLSLSSLALYESSPVINLASREDAHKSIFITCDEGASEVKATIIDGSVHPDKVAYARCHPEDTFDFAKGAKIALERVLEPDKPKETPKPWEPKVGDWVMVKDKYNAIHDKGFMSTVFPNFVKNYIDDGEIEHDKEYKVASNFGVIFLIQNPRTQQVFLTSVGTLTSKRRKAHSFRCGMDSLK